MDIANIAQHEVLVDIYSQNFVGRESQLDILQRYVHKENVKKIMVTGLPGQGKSALLAQFAKICWQKFPELFVIPYFTGISSNSREFFSFLQHIYQKLTTTLHIEEHAIPRSDICFLRHLAHICNQLIDKKIVLVIDDIHNFEANQFVRFLTYLHDIGCEFPRNVYIIFSTSQPINLPTCYSSYVEELLLPPFDNEEAEKILHNISGKYTRKIKNKRDIFQKYGITTLFMETAAKSVCLLYNQLSFDDIPNFSLFLNRIFDLLEQNHDESHQWKIVPAVLGLLSAIQGGFYRRDVENILKQIIKEECNIKVIPYSEDHRELHGRFQRLFKDLQILLINSENEEQKVFIHKEIASITSARYLYPRYQEIHKKLAQYFESQLKQNRHFVDEYTYHLWQAQENHKLYQFIFQENSQSNFPKCDSWENSRLSLYHAIQAHATAVSPEETFRFCKLALKVSACYSQVQSDISHIFILAKEGKARESLLDLEVLCEEDFFQCAVLLLWIEAQRQEKLPADQKNRLLAREIVKAIERRIKSGTISVNWSNFFEKPFMVWWTERVSEILDGDDLVKIIQISGIENSDYVIGSVILKLMQKNNWLKAFELYKGVQGKKYKTAALLDLARALVQVKTIPDQILNQLCKIVESLEKSEREPILEAVARAWVLSKTDNEKLLFLELFLENREDSPTNINKIHNVLEIASFLGQKDCVSNHTSKFCQLLLKVAAILKDTYKISLLTYLIQPILNSENKNEVIQQLLAILDEIKNPLHRNEVLTALITNLVQIGDIEQAFNILQTISKTIKTVSDEKEQIKIVSTISKSIANIENVSHKSSILQYLTQIIKNLAVNEGQTKAISEIVEILTASGSFTQALETVSLIQDKKQHGFLSAELAYRLLQAGQNEKAKCLFRDILASAHNIKDDKEKSLALSDIFQILGKEVFQILSKVDRVYFDKLLIQILTEIKYIHQELYQFTALSNITRSIVFINDKPFQFQLLQYALKIACKIKDAEYKSEILSVFALFFLQAAPINTPYRLWQKLLKVIPKISNQLYRSSAISQISQTLAQVKDISDIEAKKLFQYIVKFVGKIDISAYKTKVLPIIVQVLANYQINQNERSILFKQLLKTATKISEDGPRVDVLLKFAQTLVHMGNFPNRSSLIDECIHAVLQIKQIKNDAEFLGTLSHILAKNNDFQKATEIAESIEKDSIQKFSALLQIIQILILVPEFPEKSELLQRNIDKIYQIDHNWDESKIVLEICKLVLQSGNLEAAIKIAKKINDSIYRAHALSAITQFVTESKGLLEKPKILGYILESTKEIGEHCDLYSAVLLQIAHSLALVRDEKALEVANQIPHLKYRHKALSKIAQAFVVSDFEIKACEIFQQAMTTLYQVDKKSMIPDIAFQIVQCLVNVGNFTEAFSTISQISDTKYRFQSWCSIAIAFTRNGEKDKANEIFEKILQELGKAYDKSSGLLPILEMLRKHRQIANDELFLTNIVDILCNIKDIAKLQLFPEFIRLLIKTNIPRYSVNLLEKLLANVENMTYDWDKIKTLMAISQVLVEEDKKEQSLQIAKKIGFPFYQAKLLSNIVRILSKSQKFQDAITLAESIEIIGYKSQAMADVSIALALNGDAGQALSFANRIKFTLHRIRALAQIAQILNTKDQAQAAKTFQQSLEIAHKHIKHSPLLSEIAIALANTGEFKKPIDIVRKLDEEYYKSIIIQAVVQKMSELQKNEEFIESLPELLEIVNAFSTPGWKWKTLGKLIIHLAEVKQVKQALDLTLTIKSEAYQMSTLYKLAPILAQSSQIELMNDFLLKNIHSRQFLAEIIRVWQRAILDYIPNPAPLIMNTIVLFPGEYSLVHHGICMLQLSHARQNNWEHHRKIQECLQTFEL